jgi:siderophore synthetase component
MPHGENLILVLEDHVPVRVLMKDIAEEIVLMDSDRELPHAVERIRAEVPEELKPLSIFTDVFDCFLRFLSAVLVREGVVAEDDFWRAVAECVAGHGGGDELFAERFGRSCLNRLQLRDTRQMVDLADPAGSLQVVGELENPIARVPAGPQ